MHYACLNGHFESVVILLQFNAVPDGSPIVEPSEKSEVSSKSTEQSVEDDTECITRPVHLAAKRGAGTGSLPYIILPFGQR